MSHARPFGAPRLELARVRQQLATQMFGIEAETPTIAGYEIRERLGGGAQGDVYLVGDPRLGRQLAVKVLRAGGRTAGLDEARALAKVDHDNVVPVFDVGTLPDEGDGEGRAFIAMAYVDGDSLDRWCTERVDWARRLHVVIGAARGLAAAHRAGVVHGDFKPSNVMVSADDRAQVLDFGLARLIADVPTHDEHEGSGAGTPGYRAPECASRAADAKSDQYSLCATAWEVLLPREPVAGTPTTSAASVRSILSRGLRPDPTQRWPSLDVLVERLEATSRARGWTVPAMIGVAVVAGAIGLALPDADPADECAHVSDEIDAVLSKERLAQSAEAFRLAAPGFGADAWRRTEPRLSAVREAWLEERRDVCNRFKRSEGAADQSVQRCLQARLAELDALTTGFLEADYGLVRRAPAVLDDFQRRSECAAEPERASDVPEAVAERVREQIARAAGLRSSGRFGESLAILDTVASQLQQWPDDPLQARALLGRGHALVLLSRDPEAKEPLERAAFIAQASGADRTYADAAVILVDYFGLRLSDFEQASAWERQARASLQRQGRQARLAYLDLRWAWVLSQAGEHDEARARLDGLLARREREPELESLDVSAVYLTLARIENAAGRPLVAMQWAQQAAEHRAVRVGEHHPDYAEALHQLGVAQEQRGDLGAARESFEDALAIAELAPGTGATIGMHNGLAIVLERLGNLKDARAHYQVVLAYLEAGGNAQRRGVIVLHNNLGMLENAASHAEDALEHFRVALELAEQIYPEQHPVLGAIAYGKGVAHGRLHQWAASVDWLGRALEITIANERSSASIGKYRYVLGQAVWALGEDRDRGVALVRQGITELSTDPGAFADELAEARSWLAERGLTDDRAARGR